MRSQIYHDGQIKIQEEANTTRIASRLLGWVGPAVEFARIADLILLARHSPERTLEFTALSGAAPLVEPGQGPGLSLIFPPDLADQIKPPAQVGALAINLAQARRVRFNGLLQPHANGLELVGEEVFTLCRKYMSPSSPVHADMFIGPASREEVQSENMWISALLSRAETAFLATIAPSGNVDVAHRGGQPGFLKFDVQKQTLAWTEWLGDGVFKSAGNIRATGSFTMLVPDFESGYGLEFAGLGEYENLRTSRQQRLSPLIQENEPYPVQGRMVGNVSRVFRLRSLLHPRKPLPNTSRITSLSSAMEQQPQ